MYSTLSDPQYLQGLSDEIAKKKLQTEGYNELPSSKHRNFFAIALDVAKEPMLLLLIACGVIYLILGDKQEAVMLLISVFIVIGITLYQERKTERALDALRDLSSPRALVIRGGKQVRIPGREVVRGDIVVVAEGDRVPADAAVVSTQNLSVDESLLTGESVPVSKSLWDGKRSEGRPGGDGLPFVYSGTLVVQGKALCQVLETGIRTEMGKIGKSLQQLQASQEGTHMQKETVAIVRVMSVFGLGLCLLVMVLYGLMQSNWLQGILAGLSLAMSMLPEEFPVILTIFLALGAWRISKSGVLTRRIPAVEMLGAATVLCADKTGTLTMNRMTVSRLVAEEVSLDVAETRGKGLPERFHRLVEYSILASHKDPFDPMEKAFKRMGDEFLAGTEHLHADWTLLREYPLSPTLLAMSEVWESPDHSQYVIASKGAPEAIIDLCHLQPQDAERILRQVAAMAEDGLRVIAAAAAVFQKEDLPGEQHDFAFQFVGLLGLSDPVRPDVPDAVRECQTAGIRVIMITGDHPRTAAAIARQVGLPDGDNLVTGEELEAMDEAALRKRIGNASVFARVVPEQKLRIVNALKANGDVVAMTGDGVNDAPALKAAHIGIAMGGRGTDVAREASDLVLLDDSFASIVKSIRVGRRIYDNLKKAMSYVIAIHVPIAGVALLPVLLRWDLILTPVHIMFLEMIIDPACSIAFEMEPEERNIMHRPPHNPHEPVFGKRRILLSALQGLSVMAVALLVLLIGHMHSQNPAEIRTLTFVTLIVGNIGLILTNRSWTRTVIESFRTPNASIFWVAGGALSFLALTITVPFLRNLFRFALLSPTELALCVFAGLLGIFWFDALKMTVRRSR
jgi:Ca2+-transporting ATPase